MLIAGFPPVPGAPTATSWPPGPGSECVVVDPGKDAADGVAEVVREHHLKPVSVLVTHGHIDHMWCVAPVAGTYDATAWIHPADRHLLTDPMAGMSRETAGMLLGGKYEFAEPDDVAELADGQTLELAGLRVRRRPHARAHPRLGHLPDAVRLEQDVAEVMFSGTCSSPAPSAAPTCPAATIRRCCAAWPTKVLPLADDIVVLPGHGEQTSIGRERATNPFLLDLVRDPGESTPAPHPRPLTDEQDPPR